MENSGEIKSKCKGKSKVYKAQSREIISKVMDFMESEARADRFVIDCKKIRERVLAATGCSQSTQMRIKAEKRNMQARQGGSISFETPNRSRNLQKRVTRLDDFDLGVVRKIINNLFVVEKCLPTVTKIRAKMQTELNFTGSKSSVTRILRNIGYKWKKTKTNKHILMESHDIAYKRFVYLQKVKNFRSKGRPVFYTDESFVDSSHIDSKGWYDDTNAGILAPINKGKRLYFFHAGGEMGFVSNCLAMWQASNKTGDTNDNMNHNNYVKWLNDKLIPNLPPSSVVVIDNAPYNNVQIDKTPNSNSTKESMQNWLRAKNIPFPPAMLKVQLFELIKAQKPYFLRNVIDELLMAHGHDVLRLPPCHPELNPIKLIWAQVKNTVAINNVTFNISDVEQLTKDALQTITVSDWKKVCDHTKKIEDDFLEQQDPLEQAIESFVMSLGGDSSEDEDSSDSDNSDSMSVGNISEAEELH